MNFKLELPENKIKRVVSPAQSAGEITSSIFRTILLFVILLTLNFMYLSPDKKHWIDTIYQRFPVVKYKVNPEMIGFNTGDRDAILDAVRTAANFWSFQTTDTQVNMQYNGITSDKPMSYEQFDCSESKRQDIKNADNLVYATNTEDSDCSGQACTYIWSCEGNKELLHFDIEINARDYEWDTGTNHKKSYNLLTVVAKQFGHALGLDHCQVGLSSDSCASEIAERGTSNPDSDSIMYRFMDAEILKAGLNEDDKAGLRSLYGNLTDEDKTVLTDSKKLKVKVDSLCNPCQSPLAEPEIYKPSEIEQSAWSEYILDRTASGLETYEGKYKIFAYYQKSYFDSYRIGKVSAEDYMLDAINRRSEFLADLPAEFIPNSKKSLYVDILNLERGLKEYKNELDPMYYSFLEAEYKSLLIIRKALIEEEMRR